MTARDSGTIAIIVFVASVVRIVFVVQATVLLNYLNNPQPVGPGAGASGGGGAAAAMYLCWLL